MSLAEEIAAKAAVLPTERQREVLALLNAMSSSAQAASRQKLPEDVLSIQGELQAEEENQSEPQKKRPFRSVRGIFASSGVKITEEDIAEIRREMWANFPREEPR